MRLSYTFGGDAFADGSGGDKFLIDVSEGLSQVYGKLVRQGQVFTIRDVVVRIVNPGSAIQDNNMNVSGKLVYYAPTRYRKLAWKQAFETWLSNRRDLGVNGRGSDFRVGFSDDYSTDVGAFGTGVKFNAWINDEETPLQLNSGTENMDIFGNWTANYGVSSPDTTHKSFGHWAQKDTASLGDDLDFVTNESQYYSVGEASNIAQVIPFQVGFGAWWDDANTDPADFSGITNQSSYMSRFHAMCGLVGVYVDTTTVDDTISQTQDWLIEVSLDVEAWSPLLPRRGSSRGAKKLKGGKK